MWAVAGPRGEGTRQKGNVRMSEGEMKESDVSGWVGR